MQRQRQIKEEEAFQALFYLQSLEAKDEAEREHLDTATVILQRYLSRYGQYRKEDEKRKNDPCFKQRKAERDRRYYETHREQIREKNRRYRQENYTKEIVYAG